MTPESHDAYEEYLHTQKDPPPGLILYAAGAAGGHFRIIEIWESEETKDAFYAHRVRPAPRRFHDAGGTPLEDIQDAQRTLHALYHAGQQLQG